MPGAVLGPDGKPGCGWCGSVPEFFDYHDQEWGWPVADDRALFEKLCLEGFQSGLSWRTILAKREHFRAAFSQFRCEDVARFSEREIQRLLADVGIVRHRGKIEATINNARCVLKLVETEGSFSAYIWRYEPEPRRTEAPQTRTSSAESLALSKDLKKRGFQFVGPTTAFAFMQAMGLINDHLSECVVRSPVERARKGFQRPARSRP